MMIWHVPNEVELQDWSDKAFLKYYTNNNFLSKYGGTLQSLFASHAPLVHAGELRMGANAETCILRRGRGISRAIIIL